MATCLRCRRDTAAQIAPNVYQCQFAGDDDAYPCGFRFATSAAADQFCQCGQLRIGACIDCGTPACIDHGRVVDGGFRCWKHIEEATQNTQKAAEDRWRQRAVMEKSSAPDHWFDQLLIDVIYPQFFPIANLDSSLVKRALTEFVNRMSDLDAWASTPVKGNAFKRIKTIPMIPLGNCSPDDLGQFTSEGDLFHVQVRVTNDCRTYAHVIDNPESEFREFSSDRLRPTTALHAMRQELAEARQNLRSMNLRSQKQRW